MVVASVVFTIGLIGLDVLRVVVAVVFAVRVDGRRLGAGAGFVAAATDCEEGESQDGREQGFHHGVPFRFNGYIRVAETMFIRRRVRVRRC